MCSPDVVSQMIGTRRAAGKRRSGARRACLMAAGTLIGLAGGTVSEPAVASAAGARVALPDPVPAWTQYDTDDGPAGSGLAGRAAPRRGDALRHGGVHAGKPRLRHVRDPRAVQGPFRYDASSGRCGRGVGQVGWADGRLGNRALCGPDRNRAEAQLGPGHLHPLVQQLLHRPYQVRTGERHIGSRVGRRGRDGGDRPGRLLFLLRIDGQRGAPGVIGTTLQIGKTGTVTGELGWGDNDAEENAAGTGYQQAPPGSFEQGSTGGRSTLFAQPAYQRGVVPASLSTDHGKLPAGREVPDIAADASPMTGWTIGFTAPGSSYGTQIEGGTSGAAPIVASLEADAKQPAGHAIGFANPLLYDLRKTSGIRDIVPSASPALTLAPDCYNDQIKPNPACLVTLSPDSSLTEQPGYDDVTGIGAVTSHFITALAQG